MKSTQPRNLAAELAALDVKVNALLPPRYQHCYTSVLPNSMGSAGLSYGPDGRVAWDQIWTTFCDLALAGGPPHRGKLLEPVSETEVSAEPGHARALAALGVTPLLDLGMRLGEGTGALLALPVVASAARALQDVATFDAAGVVDKTDG